MHSHIVVHPWALSFLPNLISKRRSFKASHMTAHFMCCPRKLLCHKSLSTPLRVAQSTFASQWLNSFAKFKWFYLGVMMKLFLLIQMLLFSCLPVFSGVLKVCRFWGTVDRAQAGLPFLVLVAWTFRLTLKTSLVTWVNDVIHFTQICGDVVCKVDCSQENPCDLGTVWTLCLEANPA